MGTDLIKRLSQPLNPEAVKTRKKAKTELKYLSGFQAEATANEVFEFKWSCETLYMEKIFERTYVSEDVNGIKRDMIEVAYKAKVRVSVKIDNELIVREGTGAGNGICAAKQQFDAYELAIKEAETDAKKRALKSFGDRFGLSLYDKDIDLKREFQKAKAYDIEYVETVRRIENEKDKEKLKDIYKTYKGAFKDEVLATIIMRLKELK